jgi:hypothetical protein
VPLKRPAADAAKHGAADAASRPAAPAKRQPVAVAAGGRAGRMQTATAAAVNGAAQWKEF